MITCSCKVTWKIRSVISLLPQGLWQPNLARWWLTMTSLQAWSQTTLWTCDNKKHYLSTNTMPMATKLGRVVTYNEESPSIKSQDPMITYSCMVMRKNEYVISLLPQDLWPLKSAMWWVTIRGFHAESHTTNHATDQIFFIPTTRRTLTI